MTDEDKPPRGARTRFFSLRFTPAEYERAERLAERRELGVGAFLRQLLVEESRRVEQADADLARRKRRT